MNDVKKQELPTDIKQLEKLMAQSAEIKHEQDIKQEQKKEI